MDAVVLIVRLARALVLMMIATDWMMTATGESMNRSSARLYNVVWALALLLEKLFVEGASSTRPVHQGWAQKTIVSATALMRIVMAVSMKILSKMRFSVGLVAAGQRV
jgi:hypothetical protein